MGKTITTAPKYIPIRRQLATDSVKFSAPYSGVAVFNPSTKTMDLHLSCYVEAAQKKDGSFNYFSFKNIIEDCGIHKISLPGDDLWYGTVTPFGDTAGTTTDGFMGRAGLTAVFTSKDSGEFALGRMYKKSDSETTAIGAWPMNKENLIIPGRGYTMDFYGLLYE